MRSPIRSRYRTLAIAALVALAVVGCESRTDKTDGGGVVLSISDFDGLPIGVNVEGALAAGGFVQVEEFVIENIPKDPNGITSDLMNVEIQSYEINFSRADTGTRVPTPFVRGLFGVVPVGGDFTVENLPIMSAEQLANPPLSDLRPRNGGIDTETGSEVIILNVSLRFFGRTLSGDEVQTAPAQFTIEFS